MVFYFSGTGNSEYVARCVSESLGVDTVDIADAVKNDKYRFEPKAGEICVFCFPVYFGGLPEIVSAFIDDMRIEPAPSAIVGIATYGSIANAVDRKFEKKIEEKGWKMDAFYDIKMVENCIFIFKIPNKEAAAMTLKRSDVRIKEVIESIGYNYRKPYKSGPCGRLLSSIMYPMYRPMSGTSKFAAGDDCTGCGKCEKNCPDSAIMMEEGRPKWVKARCQHCTACIMGCPAAAIEYGNATKGRHRYMHPAAGDKQRNLIGE